MPREPQAAGCAQVVTEKKLRKQMEALFGVDLQPRKDEFKILVRSSNGPAPHMLACNHQGSKRRAARPAAGAVLWPRAGLCWCHGQQTGPCKSVCCQPSSRWPSRDMQLAGRSPMRSSFATRGTQTQTCPLLRSSWTLRRLAGFKRHRAGSSSSGPALLAWQLPHT